MAISAFYSLEYPAKFIGLNQDKEISLQSVDTGMIYFKILMSNSSKQPIIVCSEQNKDLPSSLRDYSNKLVLLGFAPLPLQVELDLDTKLIETFPLDMPINYMADTLACRSSVDEIILLDKTQAPIAFTGYETIKYNLVNKEMKQLSNLKSFISLNKLLNKGSMSTA